MKSKLIYGLKIFSLIAFIGCLIGLFVGLYQLGLQYISLGASTLSNRDNIWYLLIYIFMIIGLSIINFFILKYDKDLDGSGIPQTIEKIKNKGKINNKLGILNIILSTYISSFALMPLGSEAPSLVLSSRISSLTLELFKVDDSETIKFSMGAGFGCAFLSPLTGLVFMFEHEKKLKISSIIKGILLMGFAFLITFFINKHRLLEFSQFSIDYDMNYFYLLLPICLITICFAYCFNNILYFCKKFINKHNNNFIIKYRGFILFLLSLILVIFFYIGMGNGLNTIGYALTLTSVLWLFIFFIFRFFLTILYGCGGVCGGLVVPTMAVGGLLTTFIISIISKFVNYNTEYTSFYVLIGMCLFFSLLNKRPLTGATLVLSTLLHSTNYSLNVLPICFMIYLLFCVSNFIISKFMKHDIYGYLLLAEQN